jgi:hypothetical protein
MATTAAARENNPHNTLDPLWRHTSQLCILLRLLGIERGYDHVRELAFLGMVQDHLSLLTATGSTRGLSPDPTTWGPGTIDAVSIAFINNRVDKLWGSERWAQPSLKERFYSPLSVFFYFLISLALPSSPATSSLFSEGGAYAVSADLPDSRFYVCLTQAFIMVATYPATVSLKVTPNLVNNGIKILVVEIPCMKITGTRSEMEVARGNETPSAYNIVEPLSKLRPDVAPKMTAFTPVVTREVQEQVQARHEPSPSFVRRSS